MAVMSVLPMVLSVGSTILGAIGQSQAASAQEAQLQYRANALRMQAQAERGASSYEAAQEERRKNLAIQRGQAVAAASGAGAQDPTVATDIGNIAGQGEYNSLMRLATGEQRARGLETQAGADTFEAGQISAAQPIRTFGSIIGGASSFFSKYGDGGFDSSSIDSGMDYSANPGLYPPPTDPSAWNASP